MALDADTVEPGLYFGMSDEFYHSIPALSSTGIKNLLISPMDFWARCRWLNPLLEEEVDSDAKKIGKAYHKRTLEGKAAFDACYAADFLPPPDCLETIDDIKAALAAKGIEAKGKRKKEEFVALARESLPDALIYDDELAKFREANKGKTFLSQKLLDKIEISAAMIEKHPELAKCFSGGYPEVTVIWEEEGIRMKARFDYLKPRAISDLKTFANQMNKPIDRAIYSAMANYKYHIQGAFYLAAAKKAQEFVIKHIEQIKQTKDSRWVVSLDENGDVPLHWLAAFADCEEHGFYYIFQQKGVAPLARGKKFERGMVYGAGITAIEQAKQLYKDCFAKFGSDPWIDDAPISSFHDDEFPAYTTDL